MAEASTRSHLMAADTETRISTRRSMGAGCIGEEECGLHRRGGVRAWAAPMRSSSVTTTRSSDTLATRCNPAHYTGPVVPPVEGLATSRASLAVPPVEQGASGWAAQALSTATPCHVVRWGCDRSHYRGSGHKIKFVLSISIPNVVNCSVQCKYLID
jgi:hypothetical protein